MKEDILEQVVEDWLLAKSGMFVRHNVKFRPSKDDPEYESKKDSTHSDIDVLGINVKAEGDKRVWAVSCKSWQNGFNVNQWHKWLIECPDEKSHGREHWKSFREICKPKWSRAFIKKIQNETGSTKFTYCIACTKVIGDPKIIEDNFQFRKNLDGNTIKIITFEEMFNDIKAKSGTTLASTQLGRLMQLMNASGVIKKVA